MKRPILLGTGSLVAFLKRRDQLHDWVISTWDTLESPLLTCESVLSEALFLFRNEDGGQEAVIGLVNSGTI